MKNERSKSGTTSKVPWVGLGLAFFAAGSALAYLFGTGWGSGGSCGTWGLTCATKSYLTMFIALAISSLLLWRGVSTRPTRSISQWIAILLASVVSLLLAGLVLVLLIALSG